MDGVPEVPEEDRETYEQLVAATAGHDAEVAAYRHKERGVLPFTEVQYDVLLNALDEYVSLCVERGWKDDAIEAEVLMHRLRTN